MKGTQGLGNSLSRAAIFATAAISLALTACSSGGGGGFWLLHRASDDRQVMLDGRERAPLAAKRATRRPPLLLVAPASPLAPWLAEARRLAPGRTTLVQPGATAFTLTPSPIRAACNTTSDSKGGSLSATVHLA